MVKNYIILLAILILGVSLHAQDFHYSQFYNSPITLNPALTGVFNGSMRVGAIYRNQWWNSTQDFGSPSYATPSASIEVPIRLQTSAIGIGAAVLNDNVGGGLLNDLHLLGSLSYIQRFGQKHQLSFGMQAAFTNRSYSNNLQFASQFQNNQFNANFSIPENLADETFNKMDVNAGLLWYANFSDKFNLYLGTALYNIAGANDAYVIGNNRDQYMRFSASAGVDVAMGSKLRLMPSILYMKQQNIDQLNSGIALAFLLGNPANKLYIGGYARTNGWIKDLALDACIPYAAVEIKGLRVGLSYDYTLSELKNAPKNTGALELSGIYVLPLKQVAIPELQLFCPRF